MLIDFQTVFVQIINFLVLVALLKRFLYKPIIKAMRQREQYINGQLQEAAEQKAIAQNEAQEYRHLQATFEAERESLVNQARKDAENYRRSLFQSTKSEVDAVAEQWSDTVKREQLSFLKMLRQQIGAQLLKTVRSILSDLSQAHLEQQIVDVFLQHLSQLSASEQQILAQALSNHGASNVRIYSAFPLTMDQQTKIYQALSHQILASETQLPAIQFEQQPALLCGIELSLPGYKLAWSIDHYLQTFEETITQLLDRQPDFTVGVPSSNNPL